MGDGPRNAEGWDLSTSRDPHHRGMLQGPLGAVRPGIKGKAPEFTTEVRWPTEIRALEGPAGPEIHSEGASPAPSSYPLQPR